MAVLIGISEDIKGARFEITKDRLVLGRHLNCDIILKDKAVSSQHCYIARRGSSYVLHDLNSTNGTRLNSERVAEAELIPKQVIQLGSSELMFDSSPSESAPAAQLANTQVVTESHPPTVITPKSFANVSPFGARRRDHRGLWLTIFIVVGLLALVGLFCFLRKLLI